MRWRTQQTEGGGEICGVANFALTTSRFAVVYASPCVNACAASAFHPSRTPWGGCIRSWWRCGVRAATSTGGCGSWAGPTSPPRSSSHGYQLEIRSRHAPPVAPAPSSQQYALPAGAGVNKRWSHTGTTAVTSERPIPLTTLIYQLSRALRNDTKILPLRSLKKIVGSWQA